MFATIKTAPDAEVINRTTTQVPQLDSGKALCDDTEVGGHSTRGFSESDRHSIFSYHLSHPTGLQSPRPALDSTPDFVSGL